MKSGIIGVHHLGMSVPDLEAAKAFYVGSLGFEIADEGTFQSNDMLDEVTGLRNVACRMALLCLGNVYLEIFQFDSPVPSTSSVPRPVRDYGYSHLTLEVSDIQRAYRELSDAGVNWNCPPVEIAPGYMTTYGRDPFGNVLEIQQVAESKNYSFTNLPIVTAKE